MITKAGAKLATITDAVVPAPPIVPRVNADQIKSFGQIGKPAPKRIPNLKPSKLTGSATSKTLRGALSAISALK